MKILNGKKLSEKIIANLKREIKRSKSKKSLLSSSPCVSLGYLKLRLAVIQVGQNTISQVFINQKEKACREAGIVFKLLKFPAKISKQELKKEIIKITKNPRNSGIIIQLPLPQKFPPEEFLNLIPEKKDIDVLSEKSLGKFYQGIFKILPPIVNGILSLLKNYKIKLKGKNIVVIGAGRLVGFPLAVQLLREKATLSVLNEFTKEAPFFIKKADILISGAGKPNLIKGNMVKKGVIVIDAGTSVGKDRLQNISFTKEEELIDKLIGDVDFESVSKKASYITPVPGGVGPLTVACLLENLLRINK